VEDEMVARHPRQGWSEERLRKAVSNVLDGLRQFVEPEEEPGGETRIRSCNERLQQLYKQTLSALKKEVYAQKFIILSVVRDEWDKYHWVDVVCALKRNADDCGENSLYDEILSQWTHVCQEYLLFCFQIPCNWEQICEFFEERPPTLTGGALTVWHRRARKKILTPHYNYNG
jgi:PAS domain-containing protein